MRRAADPLNTAVAWSITSARVGFARPRSTKASGQVAWFTDHDGNSFAIEQQFDPPKDRGRLVTQHEREQPVANRRSQSWECLVASQSPRQDR
jgi:hypothetical protein